MKIISARAIDNDLHFSKWMEGDKAKCPFGDNTGRKFKPHSNRLPPQVRAARKKRITLAPVNILKAVEGEA